MEPVEASGGPGNTGSDRTLRLWAFLRQGPLFCGTFAIVVGLFALSAWWLGRPQVTAIVAELPVVMPNTALIAILAGASLILLAPLATPARRGIAGQLCAVGAGTIAGLTLAEYALQVNLGIDHLLANGEAPPVPGNPGRPSLEAATALVFAAAGLFTLNRKTARGIRPAETLALVSALIGLVALLGHLFRIAAFYDDPTLTPYAGMSILSSFAVLALSAGVMSARIDEGVLSILVTHDSGGIAARQLMASLAAFVPVVCAVAVATQRGLVSAPSATALIVLAGTVGGGAFILRVSRRLSQLDTERTLAEAQLRVSQERLDLALRGADLAAWDWNVKSGEVIFDERWAGMRGFRLDEIAPHVDSWISGVHPDDWPRVQQTLHDHFEGRLPEYEAEHRVRTRSGDWMWILDRGKVFARDEHGRPTRMTGTELDITSRKRLEEERAFLAEAGAILASSLEYEETLTSVAQLAVRDLAELCAVDLVEDGEVRRLKVVSRDPSKAWISELLVNVKFDRAQPHLIWKVLETKQPLLMETVPPELIEAWSRIGDYRRVLEAMPIGSILTVPLLAHGNPVGIIGLARSTASRPFGPADLRLAQALAERAALAIENAGHYRAAQRAVEARDSLMGIVAHDLRNPLGTIVMQAAALRRRAGGEPDRRSQRPSELIERAATRMKRLIQDLLDVTSLEAGHLSLACSRVDPRQLVCDAVDAQTPSAAAASLTIDVDVTSDLPELWGDRERLLQVFENLIGNAVKFTGPDGRITVGASPADGRLLFRVTDTGEGIDDAALPHVFDRFWQGRKAGDGGAGLGLPIVKGIVEAHGGRVWVESTPGLGSTFSFTIPVAPSAQDSRPHDDIAPAANVVAPR
jgi:PAS domain S-box-containing protein